MCKEDKEIARLRAGILSAVPGLRNDTIACPGQAPQRWLTLPQRRCNWREPAGVDAKARARSSPGASGPPSRDFARHGWLMIRRPPRSTLFPTRSDLGGRRII